MKAMSFGDDDLPYVIIGAIIGGVTAIHSMVNGTLANAVPTEGVLSVFFVGAIKFTVLAILGGVMSKAGKDLYDFVKQKIKNVLAKKAD